MSGPLKISRLDSPLARTPDGAITQGMRNAPVAAGEQPGRAAPAAPPLDAVTRQLATRLPATLVDDLDDLVHALRKQAGGRPSDMPAQDVIGALLWAAVAAGPINVGEKVASYRAARHEATAAAMRRP